MVECTGLENRRRATYRGFESHPLRVLQGLRDSPGWPFRRFPSNSAKNRPKSGEKMATDFLTEPQNPPPICGRWGSDAVDSERSVEVVSAAKGNPSLSAIFSKPDVSGQKTMVWGTAVLEEPALSGDLAPQEVWAVRRATFPASRRLPAMECAHLLLDLSISASAC